MRNGHTYTTIYLICLLTCLSLLISCDQDTTLDSSTNSATTLLAPPRISEERGLVVAIKLGENEPKTYDKFHQLRQHFDVVDVFTTAIKTFGREGDKQFYALVVDETSLSDEDLYDVAVRLDSPWQEGDVIIAKSLYFIQLGAAPFLSDETKAFLEQMAHIKRNIAPQRDAYIADYIAEHGDAPPGHLVSEYKALLEEAFDVSSVNDFDVKRPFEEVAAIAINKKTRETLAEELGLPQTVEVSATDW